MCERLGDSSTKFPHSLRQLNWLVPLRESSKEHFLPSEIFEDRSESDSVVFPPGLSETQVRVVVLGPAPEEFQKPPESGGP